MTRLEPRFIRVLKLVATDHSSKEISVKLGLTYNTVERYREHIMERLDLHSAVALTHYAISRGLVKVMK